MRVLGLLLLPLAACLLPAQALLPFSHLRSGNTEGSFSANRPGFGTSTGVVALGFTQVESGFSWARVKDGGASGTDLVIGSPVIRVGIAPAVEFLVGGDGFNYSSWRDTKNGPSNLRGGFADTSVGFKLALTQQRSWLPSISLSPSVSAPTGARAFTSTAYDPSLGLSWSLDLPARLNVSGTLTASSITSEGHRYLDRSNALSLSRQFGRSWTAYGEAYVGLSTLNSSYTQWSFDGGVARMLGHHMQVDVETGTTVLPGGSRAFVSGGVAYEMPNVLRHIAQTLR